MPGIGSVDKVDLFCQSVKMMFSKQTKSFLKLNKSLVGILNHDY